MTFIEGERFLEQREINAINKALKKLEDPFKNAKVGERIASGGQAAVYFLNTKSSKSKYVIKISTDAKGLSKIINFNNEFFELCEERKKSGKERIDDLFLKIERYFDVAIKFQKNNYILYCTIEKFHSCLNDYKATETNPTRDDLEIAIRLGADFLTLLSAMEGKFYHRDIKPGNIFLKTNKLSDGFCLGDFGIMTRFSGETLTTQNAARGTVPTAAPDVVLRKTNHEIFGGSTKGDMYSLGATIYYFLNDRTYPFIDCGLPFLGIDWAYWEHLRREGCEPPKHGSQKLKEIVCKALKFDPKDRFVSCAEMLSELKKTDEYKNFIKNPLGIDATTSIEKPIQNKPEEKSNPVPQIPSAGNHINKKLDGRYELHDIISTENTAVVYKAYDNIDKKIVAVKIFKEEYLANKEFCRKFKIESKAAAVLSHPNIVTINSVTYGNNLLYMVTQYIEGCSLKEYIEQKGELGLERSIYITDKILRALQYAHNKGVVHKAINFQNIILCSNGNIKITNFGIPCLDNNETADKRYDIYSIGVVLYEMLTGQPPFFRNNNDLSSAIMKIHGEPKHPREFNSSIPVGLDQIVMRAIWEDNIHSYFTIDEMLRDIEEFKRNPSMHFSDRNPFAHPSEDELMPEELESPLETPWGTQPIETITPVSAEYTYAYYHCSKGVMKNPYAERAIQAQIIDKIKNKIIYVQDTGFRSSEVKFSCSLGTTNLIEKKEDGYWYLNGAVTSYFDVYLNGTKKSAFLHRINDGDTITLCGVAGKGRSEYRGKTFEYQFFLRQS